MDRIFPRGIVTLFLALYNEYRYSVICYRVVANGPVGPAMAVNIKLSFHHKLYTVIS